MHKTMLIVMVLAAGICFGAGVQKAAKKFPWAADNLNADCGRTQLEWLCAANSIPAYQLQPLDERWDLLSMEAEPKDKGLAITVNVTRRRGFTVKPGDATWQRQIDFSCNSVLRQASTRYYPLDKNFVHCAVLFHVDGKLVAIRTENGLEIK